MDLLVNEPNVFLFISNGLTPYGFHFQLIHLAPLHNIYASLFAN